MADPTWNDPITSYFTQKDVDHMKQVSSNGIILNDYNSVVANAEAIDQMTSTGQMPPGKPWPQDWVNNFETWANNGFPQS